MPVFDPMTAGALLVLAASSKSLCTMPKPADISVVPTTKEVAFDLSQSMEQLQQYSMDTIDPHGFGGISMTQGFMKGAIRMAPSVKLDYEQLPKYGAVCLWYDHIKIDIEIDPQIVIAKEVAADKCMLAAVKEHEMLHVNVDRNLVNKYARIMGEKIYAELKSRGFKSEPVKTEHAQDIADRMQKTVIQIIEHEYKKMDLERTELQRAVDNREEYDRVNALCPKFHEKRAALLRKEKD